MKNYVIVLLICLAGSLSAQITPLESKKLSPPLRANIAALEARSEEVRQHWALSVRDTAAFRQWLHDNDLASALVGEYPPAQIFILSLPFSTLWERLLPLEMVLFVDSANRRAQEELAVKSLDLSANHINRVHHALPLLNGRGLTVSVKENDFDSNDIDFVGRTRPSAAAAGFFATHASIMATIIAGGGNTFYTSKGVAWGAQLTSASFRNLLPEPDAYYDTLGVSVQNHSYGVGIENYYGNDAAAYDASVQWRPTLLHVFSAGNRGNQLDTLGTYAGVEGYANLSGSFKMAKNILTVGSTDSLGKVPLLSSKGPAHDGRLKPDLVAYGLDGSSGAAAIVSGIGLLLQQAWQTQHNGQLPAAALLRAVLLNSADDVETPGIDFQSGYGQANAWRAVETIREGRYFAGTARPQESGTFVIEVPIAARQLKVTLAWTDPPATPDADTALVNDLDLELHDLATGTVWLPWVLNAAPHLDSLTQLPVRRADRLNNVEQITLENPAASAYQIKVGAYRLATNEQPFYIAWQYDTEGSVAWMFPTADDNLLAGETALLRWTAVTEPEATATLEYSLNEGQSWQTIDTVSLAKGHFAWQTPPVFAEALLRLTTPDSSYTSGLFTISQPLKLETAFNCPDSVLLFWQPEPAADTYVLSALESNYLTPVATLQDTFIILDKKNFPAQHYAIAPVIRNGRTGLRSMAINYTTQGVDCYITNLLGLLDGEVVRLQLALSSAYELQNVVFEKFTPTGYRAIGSLASSIALQYEWLDPTPATGLNTYRACIQLRNGATRCSEPVNIFYQGPSGYLVFPNPVSNQEDWNVLIPEAIDEDWTLELYDALGRLGLRYPLLGGQERIPMQRLPPGVYHFVIRSGTTRIGQGKLLVHP